jgi:pimeloyl-ACP methyl ester carboxylesterase
MPVYEREDVRIQYEEAGSGFPLLVMPGGGLSSHMGMWERMPFHAVETFKNDFRVITMDQRNSRPESTGPVQVDDPWGAFADDQLGLMDHLGIQEFMALGLCIGGPFVLKLAERAPERLRAVVMCQPVGQNDAFPNAMYDSGVNTWAPMIQKVQPDLTTEHLKRYLHNLYREPPEFVYSVTRDFVRRCQTPILVMPDDSPAHSYDVAIEVTQIAPNVEATIYPWKETPEQVAEALAHVMRFLKANEPVGATA